MANRLMNATTVRAIVTLVTVCALFSVPIVMIKDHYETKMMLEDADRVVEDDTGVCPELVRKQQGLYRSPSKKDGDFSNVVLLTASNYAWIQFLHNWQRLVERFGLKYVVLSLDEQVYKSLYRQKTDYAVSSLLVTPDSTVTGNTRYQGAQYNKLVCNKPQAVLYIMERCGVDVVFSDADVAFLKDPFQHNQLGQMILNGHFDYIYSVDYGGWTPQPRQHSCITKGKQTLGGNTGFHYLKRTPEMMDLLRRSISKCSNFTGDQGALWNTLLHDPATREWKHCGVNQTVVPAAPPVNDADTTANGTSSPPSSSSPPPHRPSYCCLDPHYFSAGNDIPNNTETLVTYHANWVIGQHRKRKNLKRAGAWMVPPTFALFLDRATGSVTMVLLLLTVLILSSKMLSRKNKPSTTHLS